MRRTVFAFFAAAATLLSTEPVSAASLEDWAHDIDLLVSDIAAIHPNPFTKVSREAFFAQAAGLKQALPSISEEQRMVRHATRCLDRRRPHPARAG